MIFITLQLCERRVAFMFGKSITDIVVRKNENSNVDISKAVIIQPKLEFGGGSIKWLPDKYKAK